MTVTKDVAASKYVPISSAEVTSFLAGTGVAAPVEGWQMQDASSPIVDFIGANPMNDSSEAFQQTVTGWTRKGILSSPAGGAHGIGTTNNITASGTALMLYKPNAVPSANRVIAYFLGMVYCVDSSGRIGLSGDFTSTFTFGSAAMGTTVRPVVLRVNGAGLTGKVTTDQESVSSAIASFDTANKLFFGNSGGFGIGGADECYLFGLRWSSLLSDADVTAVISRFTTGAVASIAVTPSSPSIVAGNTQQFTATATFQDGSTLDVTNNALTVWTSGTPATGTISSTGLFTAVALGTTAVTAAFGGVTSSVDTVTVISGAIPTSITFSPGTVQLRKGQAQQLTATGHLVGGGTVDITGLGSTSWSSSNSSIVSVGDLVAGGTPGLLGYASSGVVAITVHYLGVVASMQVVAVLPSTDENEHHPFPGILRGLWDYQGGQIVWTGDRVLVARKGDYSLGSSAFWHRNVVDPSLMKRGIPAYLPLQVDSVPPITSSGVNGSGVTTNIDVCLTPTLRAIIVTDPAATGFALDVFDRTTNALIKHQAFAATSPMNPRIMRSGNRLIATWMDNNPGALVMTSWTGDGWSTPTTLASGVKAYNTALATDGVHFVWRINQTAVDGFFIGKMVGASAATLPYGWGTSIGTHGVGGCVDIGVAPDNTLAVAYQDTGAWIVNVSAVGVAGTPYLLDATCNSLFGIAVCSRGLKNSASEYEWLVHYVTTAGALSIRSAYPTAGATALTEIRYNSVLISKSFRIGDEVFVWVMDTNAKTYYLLGGHYKGQVCGYSDRETGFGAPHDGVSGWLHQMSPDPNKSGSKYGPYTAKKVAGLGGGVWDAQIVSSQAIVGDGYVEWSPADLTSNFIIGLSGADATTVWDSVGFGMMVDGFDGTKFRYRIMEAGVTKFTNTVSYAAGDKFRVTRTAGVITYTLNGVLIYTSLATTALPLIVDSSFDGLNSTASNLSFVDKGTPVSVDWLTTNVLVYSQVSGYGPTKTGTNFSWARLYNTGQPYLHAGNARIGDMDFMPALSTAAFGRCVYVSGSAVRCWDGTELGDAGFQSYPTVASQTASAGGSLSAGQYRWSVYAVRYNKQGERFESAALVTPATTATSTQKVALVINTLPSTNHADVVFEVYRTQANGTTMYFEGTVANSLLAPTVSFNSTIADTALGNAQGDPHQTGVGQQKIIESWGPIGCSILATSNDRLWGAGGQVPPGVVQFSKLHDDGSAAGFDDLAGFQEVDTEGGAITSIVRNNDTTVVFETNKLFAISGVGPDNFGNGGFDIPQVVVADGAINHVGTILTPLGPVYWGAKGPRLLTGNYSVMNISTPVQPLSSMLSPSGVRVDYGRQEVMWYTKDGAGLLWNFLDGGSRWARWSNLPVAAASQTALAMTDGRLFYSSETALGDGGDEFEFKLRTGLIQPDRIIGGGMKISETGITGSFDGPHNMRARFYYDGAPCWTDEWIWKPQTNTYLQLVSDNGALTSAQVDALGLINQTGAYIAHSRTRKTDCAYLQIEVSNMGVAGPSFTPTEITLVIGVSPILARTSPNTFGS